MFQKQLETTWLQLGLDNRNANNKIQCTRSTNSTANRTIKLWKCKTKHNSHKTIGNLNEIVRKFCWLQSLGTKHPIYAQLNCFLIWLLLLLLLGHTACIQWTDVALSDTSHVAWSWSMRVSVCMLSTCAYIAETIDMLFGEQTHWAKEPRTAAGL